MARLDRDGLLASAMSALSAVPDPEGISDLVGSKGHINVAASQAEVSAAIRRLSSVAGYRWVVINAADLFAVNPLTMGTKVGILDQTGRVLKAADLPRPK
ncbi:MAG TPA: hypothetical protein VGR46_15605 [Candidatus Limnocylindria bacterium]|nr:hypothetical protein [Candidatus Limnocylindria bacterium]